MTSPELDNLVKIGRLKREPPSSGEFAVVFQCLPHTLNVSAATWRVLAKCHERRNLAEYEGELIVDEHLLSDLLAAAHLLLEKVGVLPAL